MALTGSPIPWVTIDIEIYNEDGDHFRTDRAEGEWEGGSMRDEACELTYDNGAGCEIWFELMLSRN